MAADQIDWFLWFKALHLIAMVIWFAGLFYLPRLFVYHTLSSDQISIDRFKLMERKLFYGITTPGGVLTLVFGIALLIYQGMASYQGEIWLHVKLSLILGLIIYHAWCWRLLITFKHDNNRHSHVWYRWFNEVPVLFLVVIIILAVLKPF